MKTKAIVLTGYGINCDVETAFAFELAGAEARRVHINDVIAGMVKLEDFQIMALPGGFSFGDDIASGKVFANKLKHNLGEQVERFIKEKKLVIGICNGFQAAVKFGLLPATDGNYRKQTTTLTFNDSGRFEDRWVWLDINRKSPCIWTKGIEKMYLPVRHGEGKFVPADGQLLENLKSRELIVAKYTAPDNGPANYPWNPNGSVENIAAVCDPSGRVFGLMPHPEAHCDTTNHPRWTREPVPASIMGRQVFRNAVEWADANLT